MMRDETPMNMADFADDMRAVRATVGLTTRQMTKMADDANQIAKLYTIPRIHRLAWWLADTVADGWRVIRERLGR